MPTVLVLNGLRFYFYSRQNEEPPHIHVERGDKLAKYWLNRWNWHRESGFECTNSRR